MKTKTNQTVFSFLRWKLKQIKPICFFKIKTKTNEICFSLQSIKASLGLSKDPHRREWNPLILFFTYILFSVSPPDAGKSMHRTKQVKRK